MFAVFAQNPVFVRFVRFVRFFGGSPKDPGVLSKEPGVLLKDPGKDPGVLLKDPGVLLKDPGVYLKSVWRYFFGCRELALDFVCGADFSRNGLRMGLTKWP